ncbi:MAG: DUF4870 domain-containing protein [Gammaproteobacteria bacterium]
MTTETSEEARKWAAGLHLSQLANLVIPLGGFVMVIVIWQAKKDQIPGLDAHGRMVVNWLLSSLVYFIVFSVLAFVLIGIPLLIALGLISIGFAIFGTIKAYDGELWSYPLTIRFLSQR